MQDWDELPEPTDAELAEIDAAIAAAPATSNETPNWSAWIRTYPVKQAVKRVGDPDGTPDWGYRFARALLDATEEGGRLRTDADRMAYLAAQWETVRQDADKKRRHRNAVESEMPTGLLVEMVKILPLTAVARYLGVTERRLIDWMFPRIRTDRLRCALENYRLGMGVKAAAQASGVNHNALRSYLDFMREPAAVTVTSAGKRIMPPAMRQRIADMAAEGMGPKAVLAQIHQEMPAEAEGIRYTAVMKAITRARRAAA